MIFSSSLAIDCPCPYPAAIRTALEWIEGHDIAGMELTEAPGTSCGMGARYENGFLTLTGIQDGGKGVVRIFDLAGRTVGLFHIEGDDCHVNVELSPGMYVVSANGDSVKFMVG